MLPSALATGCQCGNPALSKGECMKFLMMVVSFGLSVVPVLQAQPNPQVIASLSVSGNGLMVADGASLWFANGDQVSVIAISGTSASVECTLPLGTSGTITGMTYNPNSNYIWVSSTDGNLYFFNSATERGDSCAGTTKGSYSLGAAAGGAVAVIPGKAEVWVVMANGTAKVIDPLRALFLINKKSGFLGKPLWF